MAAVRTADVVIVGNGVLGLSVAVEIARRAPETQIVVVGPPQRPMSATAAAGAMLNCFAEVTRYTARHPAAVARFTLARQALDMWPQWLKELEQDAGPEAGAAVRASHRPGTFVVISGRSGTIAAENFQAIRDAAVQHGEAHDLVDPHDVQGYAPALDARPWQVLHLPREGSVDARAHLTALEAAADALGIRTVPDTVRSVLTDGDAVDGVLLQDGSTLATRTVVLSAGAASGRLAADILPPGAVPPMLHGTGASLVVRRTRTTGPGAQHVLRTPNRAATCGLHLVPQATPGEQYVGATNLITCDPISGAEYGSTHALMREVAEQFDPELRFSHIQRWMVGARPITLDCFPLIGTCSLRGLILATGTYRDGFHCSPAIARHLAATVLDTPDDTGTDLTWFAPERPPIQTVPAEDAAAEAAEHMYDVMYEQGLSVAYFGGAPLREWAQRRTQELHDRLGEPVALAPEIIIPQFLTPKASDCPDDGVTALKTYLHAARAHHGPWRSQDSQDAVPHEQDGASAQ
ncbi:NAD(P)/FAD-dependent oxidoreductase [Streptomyces fumanus]|uniref:FAD dependent oxidoreductase domain-containing protein n=1 Tax=Streptomyces fumanus TaxID=67302 RepID=A0A919ACB2_9ACTN|nr:FAD-binding oxidoreductase [Streptomyces fumanus]GHE98477.1 hypothetical protein GCM10018772_23630 [Streptomyces fumanus]